MLAKMIADYIGATPADIQRLLAMHPSDIYQDATYQTLVENIDKEFLRSTLRDAHEAFKTDLPQFMNHLSELYDFTDTPMSAYTLSNWLVAYLDAPEHMADLMDRHNHIPRELMREGLPRLIQMLSKMQYGCKEWQQAMAVMCIPLVAPL